MIELPLLCNPLLHRSALWNSIDLTQTAVLCTEIRLNNCQKNFHESHKYIGLKTVVISQYSHEVYGLGLCKDITLVAWNSHSFYSLLMQTGFQLYMYEVLGSMQW